MTEAFDSLKENIKKRISNPFLGTFMIVWIVHNWQVVYAFFNFDNEWKLEGKLKYFNDYWEKNNFFWNLIGVAFISIGVLIITYLFLSLSRYLSNNFENVVIPFIAKISKGEIVTAEKYEEALEKINLLEIKNDSERKAKNEAINELDELQRKIREVPSMSTNNELSNIKLNYNNIIDRARKSFDKEKFEKVLLGISKGYPYAANNEMIDFLLKYNLIDLESKKNNTTTGSTSYYYKYNNLGDEFRNQYFE